MFLGYSEDEYCSARFQTTAGPGGNHGVGGTRRRSAGGKRPTILRTSVSICEQIRKRFLLMGLDPALAERLHVGEDAAAELAAIPDTEALRTADEARAFVAALPKRSGSFNLVLAAFVFAPTDTFRPQLEAALGIALRASLQARGSRIAIWINGVRAKIQRMADIIADDIIHKGVQPNFAKASVAELWAFCVAMEDLARAAIKSEDRAQIPPALARA